MLGTTGLGEVEEDTRDTVLEGVLIDLAVMTLHLALTRQLEWLQERLGRSGVGADVGTGGESRGESRSIRLAA